VVIGCRLTADFIVGAAIHGIAKRGFEAKNAIQLSHD
jgi:hypothetical protein